MFRLSWLLAVDAICEWLHEQSASDPWLSDTMLFQARDSSDPPDQGVVSIRQETAMVMLKSVSLQKRWVRSKTTNFVESVEQDLEKLSGLKWLMIRTAC